MRSATASPASASPASPASAITPANGVHEGWRLRPSRWSIIGAVVRRLVPFVVEATVVPTAVFYCLLMTMGMRWGLLGALGWSYAAVIRRVVAARRIPALVLLSAVGISLRTVVYLLSANSVVYFLQPIFKNVLLSALMLVSVLVRRPLIARFAADFCPIPSEVHARPAISRLFRHLTYLWAGVSLAGAATSLVLLLTVPVAVFVGTSMAAAWVIMASGVVVTVVASTRVARVEGLATAVGPRGALLAYVAVT